MVLNSRYTFEECGYILSPHSAVKEEREIAIEREKRESKVTNWVSTITTSSRISSNFLHGFFGAKNRWWWWIQWRLFSRVAHGILKPWHIVFGFTKNRTCSFLLVSLLFLSILVQQRDIDKQNKTIGKNFIFFYLKKISQWQT